MPFGRLPTLTRLTSVRVPRSTIETSSLWVLVTYTCLPFELNESPCVHLPRDRCRHDSICGGIDDGQLPGFLITGDHEFPVGRYAESVPDVCRPGFERRPLLRLHRS